MTQGTEASQQEYITIYRLTTQGTETSWLECIASVGDTRYRGSWLESTAISRLATQGTEASQPECIVIHKLACDTRYRGHSAGVYNHLSVCDTRYRGTDTELKGFSTL